jgi:5-methylcytosine-specific restriction endonuclease McrA
VVYEWEGVVMPIKPENKIRYPKDWKAIRAEVLERANHCCEGSPDYPDCRVANYSQHPDTGSRVVLTIAHLDHVPENCGEPGNRSNLMAWCQRCHLNYDKHHHLLNSARTRRARHPQVDLVDAI